MNGSNEYAQQHDKIERIMQKINKVCEDAMWLSELSYEKEVREAELVHRLILDTLILELGAEETNRVEHTKTYLGVFLKPFLGTTNPGHKTSRGFQQKYAEYFLTMAALEIVFGDPMERLSYGNWPFP